MWFESFWDGLKGTQKKRLPILEVPEILRHASIHVGYDAWGPDMVDICGAWLGPRITFQRILCGICWGSHPWQQGSAVPLRRRALRMLCVGCGDTRVEGSHSSVSLGQPLLFQRSFSGGFEFANIAPETNSIRLSNHKNRVFFPPQRNFWVCLRCGKHRTCLPVVVFATPSSKCTNYLRRDRRMVMIRLTSDPFHVPCEIWNGFGRLPGFLQTNRFSPTRKHLQKLPA